MFVSPSRHTCNSACSPRSCPHQVERGVAGYLVDSLFHDHIVNVASQEGPLGPVERFVAVDQTVGTWWEQRRIVIACSDESVGQDIHDAANRKSRDRLRPEGIGIALHGCESRTSDAAMPVWMPRGLDGAMLVSGGGKAGPLRGCS